MHITLATVITALYAFTSSPFHSNGNEGLGLAPLLSVHPVDVANAFTNAVLPFATSFTSKVFGAPTPSRTIDTGQQWDPFITSSFDSATPPASTVYNPTMPLPGPSPRRRLPCQLAFNPVNAYGIPPTPAPYSNESFDSETVADGDSKTSHLFYRIVSLRLFIRTVSLHFRDFVLKTSLAVGRAACFALGLDFGPAVKDALTLGAVLYAMVKNMGGLGLASVHSVSRSILDAVSSSQTLDISRLHGIGALGTGTSISIFGMMGIPLIALVVLMACWTSYMCTVKKGASASATNRCKTDDKNALSAPAATELATAAEDSASFSTPDILMIVMAAIMFAFIADIVLHVQLALSLTLLKPATVTRPEDVGLPAFDSVPMMLVQAEEKLEAVDKSAFDPAMVPLPAACENELALAPEDVPLPEAVAGELDLASEEVLLPGAGENKLDDHDVDVRLPEGGNDELVIALEDVALPVGADNKNAFALNATDVPLPKPEENELSLSPEDIALPEEDDELELAPEDVPLPEGAVDELALAPEDVPLPSPEGDELLDTSIVPTAEKVEEEQMLTLHVPPTGDAALVLQQLPTQSAAIDAHPTRSVDADGEVNTDVHPVEQTDSMLVHANVDAKIDQDEDGWNHSEDALIASRISTPEKESSSKVTSCPDLYVFAGTIIVISHALDSFNAIAATPDAARLGPPQSDTAESPRALASALELENIQLPIPPLECDGTDNLLDKTLPQNLPLSDSFNDIAHITIMQGEVPLCRPCKFVEPADWEDGEDYVALALQDGPDHENRLDEVPPFDLLTSDSFDDIVHAAVTNGSVPPRPSKFSPPVDWEDGEDYVALALLDGASHENLLDEVPPFDLLPSESFDDILYSAAEDVPPFHEVFSPSANLAVVVSDSNEFLALELALRKHEEENGENLLELSLPSLPSVEVIDEYTVPLFCRTTRRPMERPPPAHYLDEADTSTASTDAHPPSPDRFAPCKGDARSRRQTAVREMLRECEQERVPFKSIQNARQPLALNSNLASSATSAHASHKDKGKLRAIKSDEAENWPAFHSAPPYSDSTSVQSHMSTVLDFERETTPGFDFDTDSPAPRKLCSRERSPSESPSPRTPSASFDTCVAAQYQSVERGFDHGSEECAQAVETKGARDSLGPVGRENAAKEMPVHQLRALSMSDAMQ